MLRPIRKGLATLGVSGLIVFSSAIGIALPAHAENVDGTDDTKVQVVEADKAETEKPASQPAPKPDPIPDPPVKEVVTDDSEADVDAEAAKVAADKAVAEAAKAKAAAEAKAKAEAEAAKAVADKAAADAAAKVAIDTPEPIGVVDPPADEVVDPNAPLDEVVDPEPDPELEPPAEPATSSSATACVLNVALIRVTVSTGDGKSYYADVDIDSEQVTPDAGGTVPGTFDIDNDGQQSVGVNVMSDDAPFSGTVNVASSCSGDIDMPDTDKDGVPDKDDAFPNDPKESKDSDDDKVGDNADKCDNDKGPASNDGCPVVVPPVDSDKDGVPDKDDAFPQDPKETKDTDKDGVGDNADAFPQDPDESKDGDNDGVGNNADKCESTPAGEAVDTDGCSASQRDTDHDGLTDAEEAELGTDPAKADTDGDGYPDGDEVEEGTDPLDPASYPDDVIPPKDEIKVSLKAGCGFVKISVPRSGEEITIMYGEFGNEDPDGTVVIKLGKSKVVKTSRSQLDMAIFGSEGSEKIVENFEVAQKCETDEVDVVDSVDDKDKGSKTPVRADDESRGKNADTGAEDGFPWEIGFVAGAVLTAVAALRRRH